MQVNESIENYLEMILILQNKKGYARTIAISTIKSVTKTNVSHAMKLLRENQYIVMNPDGYITLTDSGAEIAERMYERHRMLAKFLMSLGVDEETAFEDACKIEHDISDKSFEAICKHIR